MDKAIKRSDTIVPTVVGQLLVSKRLYAVGLSHSEANDSFSAGLAISLFQDSVELLCWTLITELNPPISDKAAFTTYFDLIEKAPNNKECKKLPLKAKMLAMNKVRTSFKHYGILPAISEAKKFQIHTKDFLQESFSIFFDLDFDSLSLSKTIPFKDVRSSVEEAESALSEGNIRNSISHLSVARNLLFEKFSAYFPSVDSSIAQSDHYLSAIAQESRVMGYGRVQGFSYLYEYLNRLKEFHFVSICGITMHQYKFMERTLSSVFVLDAGVNFATHTPALQVGPLSEDIRKIVVIIVECSLKIAQINPEN